jgi:hypothetical protein
MTTQQGQGELFGKKRGESMSRKRVKSRKTARIYYGVSDGEELFWRVTVEDAKNVVKMPGSLIDALSGKAGATIGCHLSNCAQRNANVFPHAVKMASFTKSTALIITAIKNGQPAHAVRYRHEYSELVDLNDTDKNRRKVKANPKLAERTFTLYPPQVPRSARPGQSRPGGPSLVTGEKRAVVPRGALARAQRAGLINAAIPV